MPSRRSTFWIRTSAISRGAVLLPRICSSKRRSSSSDFSGCFGRANWLIAAINTSAVRCECVSTEPALRPRGSSQLRPECGGHRELGLRARPDGQFFAAKLNSLNAALPHRLNAAATASFYLEAKWLQAELASGGYETSEAKPFVDLAMGRRVIGKRAVPLPQRSRL